MIISRESDYAIRMLRAMADGERHGVAAMCESECIPRQFAYKILEKLEKAEIVRCIRGRKGGAELTADLHELNVYDLLGVIDHECLVNACLKEDHECQWQTCHDEACKVHIKLQKLQAELDTTFKGISLHSLIFD